VGQLGDVEGWGGQPDDDHAAQGMAGHQAG
jgi:hypothetical protein